MTLFLSARSSARCAHVGLGIYGLTFSGKFWNEEFTKWLLSEGFLQSTADTTYFVKHYPDGSNLRLIF